MRKYLLVLTLLLVPAALAVGCGDDAGGVGGGSGGGVGGVGGGVGGGTGGGDGGGEVVDCYVDDQGPADCYVVSEDCPSSNEALLNACPTYGCQPFNNARVPAETTPVCGSCAADPTD